MNGPMRIGLVTPGWPGQNTPNGIATAVWHMAKGLIAAGHRPVILAMQIDGPVPDGIPVVTVERRPWTVREKVANKLGRPNIPHEVLADSLADAVDEAYRTHGLDVVVIEETYGWAHSAIRRGRVPMVVFLHGPWLLLKAIQSDGSAEADARREAREAGAMRAAAALIAPSRNVLDAVEAKTDVTLVPRIVIPNCYAVDRTPLPFSGSGPILFVGRFDFLKGGDTVIDAFCQLHAGHPNARMTFVGPDRGLRRPDGTIVAMPETIAALPDATRAAITTLGRQTTAQVARLRRTHPIAVIASRYENFSYTMLEAMAAGQAIVSTNVGGLAEVLEDGKTALLVPPDDPTAMGDALARLFSDPALTARLGQAAHERIATDFAPEPIARKTVDFLRGVLERSPREGPLGLR